MRAQLPNKSKTLGFHTKLMIHQTKQSQNEVPYKVIVSKAHSQADYFTTIVVETVYISSVQS